MLRSLVGSEMCIRDRSLPSRSIKWVRLHHPTARYQDAIESKDCDGFYDFTNETRLKTCSLEGEKAIKGSSCGRLWLTVVDNLDCWACQGATKVSQGELAKEHRFSVSHGLSRLIRKLYLCSSGHFPVCQNCNEDVCVDCPDTHYNNLGVPCGSCPTECATCDQFGCLTCSSSGSNCCPPHRIFDGGVNCNCNPLCGSYCDFAGCHDCTPDGCMSCRSGVPCCPSYRTLDGTNCACSDSDCYMCCLLYTSDAADE